MEISSPRFTATEKSFFSIDNHFFQLTRYSSQKRGEEEEEKEEGEEE